MQIRMASDLATYDSLSISDRRKTYYEAMSSADRKRMGELRAFLGFVKVSGLPVDPSTVVCLDPPSPDIGCRLGSFPYFFELREVTDEGLARRYSESLRRGSITGGAFSQDEPLRSMVTSKAQKTYQTGGAPVDLLLYYWKQTPYDPVVQHVLSELRTVLLSGPFSRIWFYEHPERLLGVVSR
jgi:hypothetical protein